jgi:hypothetical protein
MRKFLSLLSFYMPARWLASLNLEGYLKTLLLETQRWEAATVKTGRITGGESTGRMSLARGHQKAMSTSTEILFFGWVHSGEELLSRKPSRERTG